MLEAVGLATQCEWSVACGRFLRPPGGFRGKLRIVHLCLPSHVVQTQRSFDLNKILKQIDFFVRLRCFWSQTASFDGTWRPASDQSARLAAVLRASLLEARWPFGLTISAPDFGGQGKEMVVGVSLIVAAFYGYNIGTSWVFTVYFATQVRCRAVLVLAEECG